VTVLKSKPRF